MKEFLKKISEDGFTMWILGFYCAGAVSLCVGSAFCMAVGLTYFIWYLAAYVAIKLFDKCTSKNKEREEQDE